MLNFHFNGTRSGEWGDHVTLQAAADFVWFLAITFPFFELLSGFVFFVGFMNVGRSYH